MVNLSKTKDDRIRRDDTARHEDTPGNRVKSLPTSLSSSFKVSAEAGSSSPYFLLHGYLHIQIVRAHKLRNMDCVPGCRTVAAACCPRNQNVSDPYVTVHVGPHRLVKTAIVYDNLSPVWHQQDFCVPVSHYANEIEFRVKDKDAVGVDLLGKHFLPLSKLVQFDDNGRELRTGVHRVVHLDGKARHGSLEFYVEYLPAHMMRVADGDGDDDKKNDDKYCVPGTYFEPMRGNDVKFYVNAEDRASLGDGTPVVEYGDKKQWTAGRCWRDLYESLCAAERFIYITGWAVDHTQSLLRGQDKEDAAAAGNKKYSTV